MPWNARNSQEVIKEPSYIVVIITGSEEESHRIAKLLVQQKKAAYVNIVPNLDSLFWWEGKLDSARESPLIAKARLSELDEIIELVKKAHSYEVPEIIALPIISGNEDYLKWLINTLVEQ